MRGEETPRRKTSRKAAEKSAKKLSKMIKDAKTDEKSDIEMEDSDVDEPWEPTEPAKQTEKHKICQKETKTTDSMAFQVNNGCKRGRNSGTNRSNLSNKTTDTLVGKETKVIPNHKALTMGDFVKLISDAGKEIVPIWRYDCYQLMQKYKPIQSQAGNYLHQSANQFCGYIESDRSRYMSVAVRYVSADETTYTVKVIEKESVNTVTTTDSLTPGAAVSHLPILAAKNVAKDPVIEDTWKHQEAFDIYIQALLSQCLDPNFLEGVIKDNDEFFLESIEKVSVITKSKIDKVMSSAKWPEEFMQSITTFPKLAHENVGLKDSTCLACSINNFSITLELSGQAYNMMNLKKHALDIEKPRAYQVCSVCIILIYIFHNLYHYKQILYSTCEEMITMHKNEDPNRKSQEILKDILANNQWREEQFEILQGYLANADTYE